MKKIDPATAVVVATNPKLGTKGVTIIKDAPNPKFGNLSSRYRAVGPDGKAVMELQVATGKTDSPDYLPGVQLNEMLTVCIDIYSTLVDNGFAEGNSVTLKHLKAAKASDERHVASRIKAGIRDSYKTDAEVKAKPTVTPNIPEDVKKERAEADAKAKAEAKVEVKEAKVEVAKAEVKEAKAAAKVAEAK